MSIFRNVLVLLISGLVFSCTVPEAKKKTPNIVIFYVDDLGYGDVSCYGAKRVTTPNVDALAQSGILFTDAHSSAATCTPSRYSLLTGNYAFRMNAGILPGDAPLLIKPGTATLATKLKEVGYKSAVVGKWHLGLGDGIVNWNKKVSPGPLEIGFDYSFLLPSTGDRVPSVYLENHHVVGLNEGDSLRIHFTDVATDDNPFKSKTGISNPEMLRQPADVQHSGVIVNGISRIGFMEGAEQTYWKDEDFATVLTEKASSFIKKNANEPFFLYFPFHDIHVPRLPNKKFIGTSDMGLRGDAIVQMDWITGEIMKTLKEQGLLENTIVIFTSDNGPVLNDGYQDGAVEKLGDHKPGGPYRGGKYSIYEAGNRVPTIVSWPSVIKHGESDALWSQIDVMASIAELTGFKLDKNEGIDSKNMLDVLLGKTETGRKLMLEEAFTLGLRMDDWKYIAPTSEKQEWIKEDKHIEGGLSTEPQLYDLSKDKGEQENLADKFPDIVSQMQMKLDSIKSIH